ncbi:LacI family DNA-binding transcriptional regulator [Vibrio sp. CK2-1]|uniref:LacI family DNA-binding transcriptional regulator n=1 Tax=Vibrio sp. CK2-1 TaxID=2912249 RepID=UPI001F3DC17A|nr:LacI family DNA-binding transcriptional regulator [Vibrio sp. CK2-1]MCF7352582.1 LacI family transcriptional regulator [Vibrio sp. CK2-1]
MTKIRMIDVANHANVSKSTVSQYFNGRYSHMSETTKEKIRIAVEALNYVPNPIARSLKSDKTKTIGVIVRDITGFNTSRILRGIDDFCKQAGYNVLIYNTDFDEEIEKRSLMALKQMCVDGIIITSTGKNADLINQYTASDYPVVQFQLEYQHCQTDIVLSDFKQAARKATEHLIALGHKRIGFMTQDFESSISRKERYLGYVEALKAHQIPFDKDLLSIWDRESGFEVSPVEQLHTSNPPTAFFTQHLAITVDLLKALDEHQIEIPQQVSVLGFDEIPMVDMFKVPVSVIQQDSYQLGVESASLLLNRLNESSDSVGYKKVVVPCRLVERASIQKN